MVLHSCKQLVESEVQGHRVGLAINREHSQEIYGGVEGRREVENLLGIYAFLNQLTLERSGTVMENEDRDENDHDSMTGLHETEEQAHK